MVKVAVLTNFAVGAPNGIGTFLSHLIYGLQEKVEFHVFLPAPEFEGVESNYASLIYPWTAFTALRQINRYDVLHINWGMFGEERAWLLDMLDQVRIPIVTTVHSTQTVENKYWKECIDLYFKDHREKLKETIEDLDVSADVQEKVMEYSDSLIFVSEKEQSYYNGDIQSNVIYNGVERTRINVKKIKQNTELGYFARLNYRKGLLAALSVMEYLPDYNLTLCGEPDEFGSAFLKKFKWQKNINYGGVLKKKEDISDFFQSLSLMLCNSLYEPFGYSHVEAMVNGVFPVVGQDTATLEIFGEDYPFQVSDDVTELKEIIEMYADYSLPELRSIANDLQGKFNLLDIDRFTESYYREYIQLTA